MASQYDRIAHEDNRPQQIVSPPDPESQSAQPLPSSPVRLWRSGPIQQLANYFTGFRQGLKQCQRLIYRTTPQMRDADEEFSAPSSVGLQQPVVANTQLHKSAGQCCFLCLEKDGSQVAIPVPCLRPTKPRQVKLRIRKRGGTTRMPAHHETGPNEQIPESDTAIFERLSSACFGYQGAWKKWLPFYGITNVEEVEVSYLRNNTSSC